MSRRSEDNVYKCLVCLLPPRFSVQQDYAQFRRDQQQEREIEKCKSCCGTGYAAVPEYEVYTLNAR